MKKLVLLAGVCCFAYASNAAKYKVNISTSAVATISEWAKSKDGTWEGKLDDKRVWYKLNMKDLSIWCSADGTKWDIVKDGMWQDKDGRWLKINKKMLKWSADNGKTYVDVPEWKWEGTNGTFYKLDKTWGLWSMDGKI